MGTFFFLMFFLCVPFVSLDLFFFFFFVCTCSLWKFPGQGIKSSCSCGLHHSCSVAGSLASWAGPKVELMVPQRQARSLTHCATAGTPVPFSSWPLLSQMGTEEEENVKRRHGMMWKWLHCYDQIETTLTNGLYSIETTLKTSMYSSWPSNSSLAPFSNDDS